jgi:hypothetical protein
MENVQVQHLKNRRGRGFLLLQNALKFASVHVEFQKFLEGHTPEPPLRDWTQVTEHSAFSFPIVGINPIDGVTVVKMILSFVDRCRGQITSCDNGNYYKSQFITLLVLVHICSLLNVVLLLLL